ncbi:MAG: SIS domain-containing protein [Gemmatimonadetes bacterium]|nr:SIS domain-containing protein [Gemmatimonadota bacterium]MYA65036.1 SIS domain-containing protein [Gemmatimonadota bacterium]MYC00266.1 SIS domain-containing protein [Gemmatimonadota bacterium]MYH53076.1 SIS domain-containing protein [Gemmatimonadota bacterium]MYK66417.1 SIS domain-containing protein [Gemmatimonadota bacterium]
MSPCPTRPEGGPMSDVGGFAKDELHQLAELARMTAELREVEIAAYAELALGTIQAGGKLLFCGNGGSAADAQHLAAEYVVRLIRDRRALPAIALTTDSSVLTACANDLGYEHVFARQVEALGRPGDLLVLHTTTGESENVVRAARVAKQSGLSTVALLAGMGGRLESMVDVAIVLPTGRVSRAQEIQLAIGHIVCDYVEKFIMEESE